MSDHNLPPRQSMTHFFAPKKKRLSPLFLFLEADPLFHQIEGPKHTSARFNINRHG
jgi:hypothetical protein